MNKFIRKIAAVAMAAALTVSMGVTAFAAPAESKDATITKEMTMAEGTTTPAGDVKFRITPVSVDGLTDQTGTMPVIGTAGVVSVHLNKTAVGVVAEGKKTVVKESAPLFAGVTWPHAGTYIYKITEVADTFTLANTASLKESMDYDKSEYTMTVQVFNGADGPYVGAIATAKTKDTAGGTISTTTKVEATVGYNASNACAPSDDNNSTGKTTGNDTGNGLRFVNSYSKQTMVADPTDPSSFDNNLVIAEETLGDLGNQEQYFDFTLTVTAPKVITSATPAVYTAYLCNTDGEKITSGTANGLTFGNGGAITVTPGAALNFKLKHNQGLVFTNIPVGATYTASETDPATGYTVSTKQVVNGGTAVSTPNNKAFASTRIGEGKNSAMVSNTRESVEVTGIVENTLPYALLLAIAAGGFLALRAFNKRRKLVK